MAFVGRAGGQMSPKTYLGIQSLVDLGVLEVSEPMN